MHERPFLSVLLLIAPCGTLMAQGQVPFPEPGTRARLTFPCDATQQAAAGRAQPTECRSEGTLVMVSRDTIVLDVAGSTTGYGRSSLRRLEVSRGRRSHWLVGAGVGFVVGAGATFAVLYSGGSTALCDRSANQDAMSSGECIGLTALGGLAGAGLGALIGSRFRSEQWQDVPIERVRIGLGPQVGGRFGLALTVAF